MSTRDIIVIGASAGGVEALKNLVAAFPRDLPAAIFVTLHLSARSETMLPDILSRAGNLPASHPWHDRPIEPGSIYVAPPDHHLVLQPGYVHLSHAPRESMQRPCINVMFRSAASTYGSRVIGVLLTGLLDDGAAGLWEIQQHGGATVVQDPDEAPYPSMPQNALLGISVDYVARIAEMGPLLIQLAQAQNLESHNARRAETPVASQPAEQTCPECNGAMMRTQIGKLTEFQCHIGHRFGLKSMVEEKSRIIERAISMALSQTEELITLINDAKRVSDLLTASSLEGESEQLHKQAQQLREMLNAATRGASG